MYTTTISVQTSTNPIARQRGEWEILVGGERWFGPDTLDACLQALPALRRALSPARKPQG